MSTLNFILTLVIAFAITMVLMRLLRRVACWVELVDVPGGRKTHVGEVPVIGGIAIYLGALVAVMLTGERVSAEIEVLLAAALMVGIGALDDRFELPPQVRIVAHLVAAVTLVLATGFRVESLGNLLGFGDLDLGPVSFPFTVVAIIALVNAFNMLDGVDGVAGGVALVALAGLSSSLVPAGGIAAPGTLAVVGAVVGFLVFNLPAQFNRRFLAFMGDAGSTLLGFALAGLALVAIQPHEGGALPPAVVLWLLPVPIVELFTSTIRRLVKGISPMQADRGHFHHRLLDAGFSVRAIFLMYVVGSSGSAVIGLAAWRAGASEALLFGSFVGMSVLWLLGTKNARRLVRLLPRRLRRGDFQAPERVDAAQAKR